MSKLYKVEIDLAMMLVDQRDPIEYFCACDAHSNLPSTQGMVLAVIEPIGLNVAQLDCDWCDHDWNPGE